MKKNPISMIILMFGVGIIITGIAMTIIQLTNFNVFTFNIGKAIVFAFGFTFVGIVLIIISVIYNSKKIIDKNINTIDTIADKVKETLTNEISSKKPKKCEYCGNKIKSGTNKCENCGAMYKNNEKM